MEVEGQEAEVVLFAGGAVVWNVLHDHLHSLDGGDCRVVLEYFTKNKSC